MRIATRVGVLLTATLALRGGLQAADSSLGPTASGVPHVLQQLLDLSSQHRDQIRNSVRDYTCLIVKREQINGVLQDHRFILARVRAPGVHDGRQQILSVHLKFLKPAKFAGREVIYVAGQNNDEMIVKRGGKRFGFVTVHVAPNSELARTESLMHIGSLGFDSMVSQIVAQLRRDIAADPTGSNTEVRLSHDAKINNRKCTAVVITHPMRASGLTYYRAEYFVDSEYQIPVRIACYDWSKLEGASPPLLCEFIYTNIKINVGLTDTDFDAQMLRTAAR